MGRPLLLRAGGLLHLPGAGAGLHLSGVNIKAHWAKKSENPYIWLILQDPDFAGSAGSRQLLWRSLRQPRPAGPDVRQGRPGADGGGGAPGDEGHQAHGMGGALPGGFYKCPLKYL